MSEQPKHCEHEGVCYHMLEEVMTPCSTPPGACPYDTRSRPAPQQPENHCDKCDHWDMCEGCPHTDERSQPPAPAAPDVLDELRKLVVEKVKSGECESGWKPTEFECDNDICTICIVDWAISAIRAREVQHGKNIPMVDRGAPDRYTSVSLEEWERMQRGEQHG